jgi:hypothetical protein
MHTRIALASLVLLSAAGSVSPETQVGVIGGTVVDGKGIPIAGAKVYDEPLDAVRIGKDHFVLTNHEGRFLLSDVPAGKTMVIATNIEAGYPDARFAVYSGNEILPIVEVRADKTTSDVVVKLLSKGGVLRGKIIDADSGAAVPTARITLTRADHPGWSIETDPASDGAYEFIVPSKPLHFQINAEGYGVWSYEESEFSKGHAPLILAPESTEDISISLKRIK